MAVYDMKPNIILQPLGEIPQYVLDFLQNRLGYFFEDYTVSVSQSPIVLPNHAFDAQRNQFDSRKIISWLRFYFRNVIHVKILGIGDFAAYSGMMNFVFGQAELGGKICVVYLSPLNESFSSASRHKDNTSDTGNSNGRQKLFYDRVLKEALHELGHTYGLSHCNNSKCVMSFSNTIKDTDNKMDWFCTRCDVLLA